MQLVVTFRLTLCLVIVAVALDMSASHKVSAHSGPDHKVSEEDAVEYLEKNRALPDNLSKDQLGNHARYALIARALPFASEVSDELFLAYVLPYRHFDEGVDDWRKLFYDTLVPFVSGISTLQEAAEALFPAWSNAFGKQLEFKGNNTPQVLAPVSETLAKGYASCTGMSIFLANCFRSVGIPARIVGVAEWNRPEGGNHNWVEIWTGSGWSFVDAVPTGELVKWNSTWFVEQAALQESTPLRHAILSPIWGPQANTAYNMSWRTPPKFIPAIDVTQAYIDYVPPTSASTGAGSLPVSTSRLTGFGHKLGYKPLAVILSSLIVLLLGWVGYALKKPRVGGYERMPS